MRKIIIVSTIALILFYMALPSYEFTHYHFPYQNAYITKIEYKSVLFGNSTYFTEGKYSKRSIPTCFVKPVYSGISGGYDVALHASEGKLYVYGYNGYFEMENLNDNFIFVKLKSDKASSIRWKEMISDSTGRYIHVFY